MCGQFSLDLDAFALKDEFDIGDMPSVWEIRPNIFPSQTVAVIKAPEVHTLSMMRWGLIPFWAKDESIGRRTFNARSETLQEKPSFRKPFQTRRCLILANGFYEWMRHNGPKAPATPYRFQLASKKPFAFAGLWDEWNKSGTEIQSCTIITCEANSLIQPYHDRMPVILAKKDYQEWLLGSDIPKIQKMLMPFPSDLMQAQPVGISGSTSQHSLLD